MKSEYISIHRLKALKSLNMEKEAPLDCTQEEIEENLSWLKYKLKVIIRSSMFFCLVKFVKDFNNSSVSRIMRNEFHDKRWKESETELVKVVERIWVHCKYFAKLSIKIFTK